MRHLWLCCLWLALLLPGSSRAAGDKLSTFSLNGFNYVHLEDWASYYKFTYTTSRPVKTIQINSKWSKLEFETDSKRMILNGVAVWLSAPVALHNGSACITTLDLDNAVHPILFPTKLKNEDKITTICIDPGHGGKDPGNQNSSGQEKYYTMILAEELKAQLEDEGFKVVLTRSSDKFIELESRPFTAQKFKCDLFISIHFNGVAGGGSARGAEVYCLTPSGASSTNSRGEGATAVRFPGNKNDEPNSLLAYNVQKYLLKASGADDRGMRRARFAVLRYAAMPAILVEAGFMSDPGEAGRIRSSSQRRLMAKGIVDGVKEYRRIVERDRETAK